MEHTKHSMTSLEEYIRESLLDDFDELEAAADDNVKASSSLGKKYKVNFVRVKDLNDVLSELNTDKINSLKLGSYFIIPQKNVMWFTKMHKIFSTSNIKILKSLKEGKYKEKANKPKDKDST